MSPYASILSTFSLLIILAKGGFGFQIKKLGIMGFGYGLFPMLVNMIGVGLLIFFVMDAPYHVSIMAGICIAGIAPAVAIPLAF